MKPMTAFKIVFPVFLMTGGASLAQEPSAQNVRIIWDRHFQAFDARDMDEILRNNDGQAKIIANGVRFEGHDPIEKAFEHLFVIFEGGDVVIEKKSSTMIGSLSPGSIPTGTAGPITEQIPLLSGTTNSPSGPSPRALMMETL